MVTTKARPIMKNLCNALFALALAASASVHAAVMSIDLRGSGGFFDFDAPTGSRTFFYNAIQMDFQAVVGAPSGSGTLNATATSFGINASGSGDETSQIDADAGV